MNDTNDTRSRQSSNPLAQRSTFTHWSQENIRFSDTDMQGHVNNIAFAQYAETGRSNLVQELMRVLGTEQRALLVTAKLTLIYLGELHWPGTVDIGTGVLSIGKTSFLVGQGLFDGERCFATVETVLVSIDETSRKPYAIPDALKQYLDGFRIVPA